MKPDWLQHPEGYWSAHIGPYKAAVGRTMFNSHSWTVSDGTRVVKSGDVGELEAAQLRAEQAAGRAG